MFTTTTTLLTFKHFPKIFRFTSFHHTRNRYRQISTLHFQIIHGILHRCAFLRFIRFFATPNKHGFAAIDDEAVFSIKQRFVQCFTSRQLFHLHMSRRIAHFLQHQLNLHIIIITIAIIDFYTIIRTSNHRPKLLRIARLIVQSIDDDQLTLTTLRFDITHNLRRTPFLILVRFVAIKLIQVGILAAIQYKSIAVIQRIDVYLHLVHLNVLTIAGNMQQSIIECLLLDVGKPTVDAAFQYLYPGE
mmetsp:Transcript_50464/g.83981  ORF Transcript_50464/g.83981 Transcript_50464/m.83981 type:complete len:245 (-) Transcript_50464:555-1289(-)